LYGIIEIDNKKVLLKLIYNNYRNYHSIINLKNQFTQTLDSTLTSNLTLMLNGGQLCDQILEDIRDGYLADVLHRVTQPALP